MPSKINPRRNTLRHRVIKLTNTKEKKKFFYSNKAKATDNLQGNSHKDQLTSQQKLLARRQLHEIFKVMKGKNLQARIFYTERPSFRLDGEIKSFTDKQKLREFSTT